MATILDVAAQAGVGVGTVSRVLNASPLVSPTTRERVLAAISALDYQPSSLARNLSLGRTSTLLVVAPFAFRPSISERIHGVLDALSGTGYDIVLCNVETPFDREERFRKIAERGRADGALVITIRPSVTERRILDRARTHLVFIDRDVEGWPHVFIDDVAGGRMATEHLVALGHERIAFVGDVEQPDPGLSATKRRLRGYRSALAAAGLTERPEYVALGRWGSAAAAELSADLLSMPHPPTAVVAASDVQALGVLSAARAAGRRVPEDVAVVGFDDLDLADHVGLTTVRQPLFESGRRGAEMLLQMLGGEDPPRRVLLPLELVIRSTTVSSETEASLGW